ncbi:MAG TPA: beta-N-acetylhexosaminidase, partial [Tepidisphaeraceae bacterium]|nr:beta-N-acetylhexosaminidase [Tepidisphaeraceae bacterium]
ISRDKVPTMPTLFAIIDQLAELKINQLQLYTEHTFAYRNHPIVWKDASPITADEIRRLDAYCRERFIDLVPNQNSFGHLERWFKHPQYRDLAEAPDGFTFPWGNRIESGFSLNPLDPRSIEFIESLYDELLPNFSSKLFNVGCDETFDIGQGRSKNEVAQHGRERVYLDFLLKIAEAVKRRGKTMMFWGDIILNQPQLLSELPRDTIALNWGYEADHPFEKETRAFRDAGLPFYVCPGTSSWCSITGRTDNAIANLKNAAEHGLKYGAIGYLNTDWGDRGHLQYWPISLLGIAAGAAYAWCYQANRNLSLIDALNLHIFRDRAKIMGQLVYDLGNVHQAMQQIKNGTALFWTLIGDEQNKTAGTTLEEFIAAENRIDSAVAPLDRAQMNRADAELIRDELRNAAAMLKYACHRGRHLRGDDRINRDSLLNEQKAIIASHRRLWLARNRPGGLIDSIARLKQST